MRPGFVDELADLYPDSDAPSRLPKTWRSDTARGGIAGVHIAIYGLDANLPLELTLRKGGRISKDVEFARLIDVPVEHNTGLTGGCGTDNPHVIRKAPFRVFDALEPLRSMKVSLKGALTVLRLERAATRRESPGARVYAIALVQGSKTIELEWTVHVHAVSLPRTGKDSFPYTNWFKVETMARYHGAGMWSEKHWRMISQYAQTMARARQNVFLLEAEAILDKQADGSYSLNHKRLNRLVRIFSDAGLFYIEGPHLGMRTGGDWYSKTLSVMSDDGPTVGSPEGNAQLASICRQLMEAIRKNSWEDRWLQHCSDEPIPSHATDYRLLVGMTHKYMPGIPVLDAVIDTGLAGSVDVWCPLAHEYEAHREAFESMRAYGDKIWYYTCLQPGGKFLNRTLDMEHMRPALIAWGAALYKMDGYLHWGLNCWAYTAEDPTAIDPFVETCKKHHPSPEHLPPGDTHVVFPGPTGPWSSSRLEAHRVGMEDYELIRMLRDKEPGKADRIIRSVIRSFTDYTKDPRVYRRARRALFAALESSRSPGV
jgi:hypothetical protein